MTTSEKVKNCFLSMVYGDALGFLNENSVDEVHDLKPFVFEFDSKVKVNASSGQWSYITELNIIVLKSLVDVKSDYAVKVDYGRMIQELVLWQYYRHGSPENFEKKLKAKKSYYKSEYYWKDIRGDGFSRIIPIVLTNKNFQGIQEEVYKNIIYINRHPQVTLTALLLAKALFLILEKSAVDKNELIQQLKEYLIDLKLTTIEEPIQGELPEKYGILFEKEKVQFIMELDRLKGDKTEKQGEWGSRDVFLRSMQSLWSLMEGSAISLEGVPKKELKESLAITYGLWGVMNGHKIIDELKDGQALENMSDYINKLRRYEVGKDYYKGGKEEVNLFHLQKGDQGRHPLLNAVKVLERKESDLYVFQLIETKSGTYHFLKKK